MPKQSTNRTHQDTSNTLAERKQTGQEHTPLLIKSAKVDDRKFMNYIVTFFAHFGAIRYKKKCEETGIPSKVMPVPRELSSSCGTCVCTEGRFLEPTGKIAEEVEQIVEKTDIGYRRILDYR